MNKISSLLQDYQYKNCKFFYTSRSPGQYPSVPFPEIAFIGRSNVGKSSLINQLTGYKKLAITSNTPGRTTAINYFLIDDKLLIVDLPGYGYAKIPKELSKQISLLTQDYLSIKQHQKLIILIIDARRGIKEMDLEVIYYLEQMGQKLVLAVNKIDKLNKSETEVVKDQCLKVVTQLNCIKDIAFISCKSGEGLTKLKTCISNAL